MANIKNFYAQFPTGNTLYGIITRMIDGYRINDADGTFTNAPADPYISFTEDAVLKSSYSLSESRSAWDDGLYIITIYRQASVSPSPVGDLLIGSVEIYIKSDLEVVVDISTSSIKTDVAFTVECIKNKKYLEKVGSVWYLRIRNSTDSDDIVNKELKDSSGNNITDIAAGILAQELKTSV
jgi:hypothetical protein